MTDPTFDPNQSPAPATGDRQPGDSDNPAKSPSIHASTQDSPYIPFQPSTSPSPSIHPSLSRLDRSLSDLSWDLSSNAIPPSILPSVELETSPVTGPETASIIPSAYNSFAASVSALELVTGNGGFAVLDFETGGVDTRRHALLSVGLVILDGGLSEVGSLYALIQDDPGRAVTPEALAINGIDMSEVARDGVSVEPVLAALQRLLQGRVIVCHNATFDTRWLNDRECGFGITAAVDTMFLAYDVWPFPAKAKLGIVAERLGIDASKAHNSLEDARITASILRKMPDIHPDGVKCLQPRRIVWDYYKRKCFSTRNFYI